VVARRVPRWLPLLGICIAGSALAAEQLQVTTSVLADQPVAAADGSTIVRSVRPARVTPGDQMTLVIDYRNTADRALANVVLANPVPQGMVFKGAASGTPTPELSTDGATFATIDRLSVRSPAGQMRAATLADVIAVRWRLSRPIAAGERGRLAFHATVR
jgi:uncharacterized repeat protein (TIGR01451 family)